MIHLDITGRNVDVTPALKDFAAEKLAKLERLLDGPLEAHVVLGIEKHRHFAEIQVKSKTGMFSGHQETSDLYASIGEVVDKLERQALKHKEKIRDHKHRRGPRDPSIAAAIEANVAAEVEPQATAEAPEQRRLHRRNGYRAKPMGVEDAILELEASGDDLVLFRRTENDPVCAIYRRQDGDLVLVEGR
jgi:putative sigma-54 modulation protein